MLNSPVSRHLDKRRKTFIKQKLYVNIYSGFNHNHLQLETTNVLHLVNGETQGGVSM